MQEEIEIGGKKAIAMYDPGVANNGDNHSGVILTPDGKVTHKLLCHLNAEDRKFALLNSQFDPRPCEIVRLGDGSEAMVDRTADFEIDAPSLPKFLALWVQSNPSLDEKGPPVEPTPAELEAGKIKFGEEFRDRVNQKKAEAATRARVHVQTGESGMVEAAARLHGDLKQVKVQAFREMTGDGLEGIYFDDLPPALFSHLAHYNKQIQASYPGGSDGTLGKTTP